MTLKVENLGIVKQVRIDLSKALILFCGPNNTGKTYVSYMLQAFLSAKVSPTDSFVSAKLDEVQTRGYCAFDEADIAQYLTAWCAAVTQDLGAVFGISDDICQSLFKGLNLTVEFSTEDYQRACQQAFDLSVADDAWQASFVKVAGENRISCTYHAAPTWDDARVRLSLALALSRVFRGVVLGHFGSVRMLTVERNSIYTFKTELSISRNELIDRIQQHADKASGQVLDLVQASSRRYPQAVRSSLRIANDLENVQKLSSPYADIAERIERDLLRGEVSMTKNGDVEFHAATMAKSKKLPFHLSSSIVKTMSSFVIYLRHLAQEHDTLIIDEPEMNFHPDVQCLLTQIFALLVNRGLHVVVSTHSDYIIRELNSLVMLDALSGTDEGATSLLKDYGYTDAMRLAPERMNVLYFQPASGARKSVNVQLLTVEKDGFDVPSIDATINRQNEIAEFLFDQVHRETEE